MPRYDYVCQTCGHQFELRQSFNAEPVATCPQCENTARRKFAAVPIVFKGSGWYVNDYGKKSSTTSTSTDSSGPSTNGTGPKAETKAKDEATTSGKDAGD